MPRKLIFIGLIFTAIISLAFLSARRGATGRELRPQAVQQLRDEIARPDPGSFSQIDEHTNSAADPTPPALNNPDNPLDPAVAGTSDPASGPAVKQTIKQEITDDSVKINIEQKVRSNEPVNNKLKVKVDTKQDPPLVEISAEPNPVTCSSDRYDCEDFTTCAGAQAVYQSCTTDIHHLDPDRNGTPCDQLCL